jgi:hypothetical protein
MSSSDPEYANISRVRVGSTRPVVTQSMLTLVGLGLGQLAKVLSTLTITSVIPSVSRAEADSNSKASE